MIASPAGLRFKKGNVTQDKNVAQKEAKPRARKRMHAFFSVDWKQHTPFYKVE